jgi:hypothetical protein
VNTVIQIVPARPVHVNRIADQMRQIDRRECEAMGRTGKQALRSGLARSIRSWTALVNGRPEAMFGVVVESALGGEAIPWFLGTDEVYRHGRALLMWGPGIIERLHDSRLTLRNLVSSENRRAIRLLEKWGFEVSAEEQEIRGVMFRAFVKEPA